MYEKNRIKIGQYITFALLIVTLLATLLPPPIAKSIFDNRKLAVEQLSSGSLSPTDVSEMNNRISGIIQEALNRLLPEISLSQTLRIFVVKNYLWTACSKLIVKPNQYSRQNHLSYNRPLLVYRLPSGEHSTEG